MAGEQTWWEIVWLWSTEWHSFLVAEARAGPQLPGMKKATLQNTGKPRSVGGSWGAAVGWSLEYRKQRTAVRWPPGPGQGCEVTKRQCILDAKLGQSATRCHPIHAPWMDHATGKSKSKIQHDTWNQKEKPLLKYSFSSLSADGWRNLTLFALKEKCLKNPVHYHSR